MSKEQSDKRCRYCSGGAVDLRAHEENCVMRPGYALDALKTSTPSHVAPNPLLSHECGKNMVCAICGSLPITSAPSTIEPRAPKQVLEWIWHMDLHLTEHDERHAGLALRAAWPHVRKYLVEVSERMAYSAPSAMGTTATDQRDALRWLQQYVFSGETSSGRPHDRHARSCIQEVLNNMEGGVTNEPAIKGALRPTDGGKEAKS